MSVMTVFQVIFDGWECYLCGFLWQKESFFRELCCGRLGVDCWLLGSRGTLAIMNGSSNVFAVWFRCNEGEM